MDDDPQKAVLQPRNPGESIKVAETVLKRRDRNLKAASDRAAQIARIRNNKKEYKKGKLKIIRAEKLVKDCRNRLNDRRRLKNCGKKPLGKKGKGRIIAAVRNGRIGTSEEAKVTLRELGLTGRNSLVFLPNTDDSATKLRKAKPYTFYGPPTFKMVFDLIHKRASFKDPEQPKERKALSDNVLIEKHLGDLGVLCTEDLAHVIHTRSKQFEKVSERLWPIRLNDAKKVTGSMMNEKYFTTGNIGEGINNKLVKLLGE